MIEDNKIPKLGVDQRSSFEIPTINDVGKNIGDITRGVGNVVLSGIDATRNAFSTTSSGQRLNRGQGANTAQDLTNLRNTASDQLSRSFDGRNVPSLNSDISTIPNTQVNKAARQIKIPQTNRSISSQTSTTGQSVPILGNGQRFDAGISRNDDGALEVNFGGLGKGQSGGFISSDSLTPEKAARIQETLRTGRQVPSAGSTNDIIRSSIAANVNRITAAARAGNIGTDEAQALIDQEKGKFQQLDAEDGQQLQAQQQAQFGQEQAKLAASGDVKGLLSSFARQGRKGAIEALGKTVGKNGKKKQGKPFFKAEDLAAKLPAGTPVEVRNFFLQSNLDESSVNELRDLAINNDPKLTEFASSRNIPIETLLAVLLPPQA